MSQAALSGGQSLGEGGLLLGGGGKLLLGGGGGGGGGNPRFPTPLYETLTHINAYTTRAMLKHSKASE